MSLARRATHRLRYLGLRRRCPNCRARLRAFERYSPLGEQCPRCGARDRHRLLAIYLREVSEAARRRPRVLHFSPEESVRNVLDELEPRSYLSIDLEPGLAELTADITDLPLDDASFDLLICSHVLEHVPDDRAALGELARVVADRGEIVILTPVSRELPATIEDPDASPRERLERFGQDDHVRVYGPDLIARIEEAGLEVTGFDPDRLSPRDRRRVSLRTDAGGYGLRNELFVAGPRRSGRSDS